MQLLSKNIFFFLFAFLFSISLNAQEKPNPQHKVKIGELAPEFTICYTNGKKVQLSDFRGKVVMLQFTASWCSVCLREMPFIESEIWKTHKNNPNFVLVAVDFEDTPEQIKQFIKKAKISYPMALDPDGKIFELYAEKGAGVTRNVIIDKTGKIAFLTRLFDRDEFNEMKEKIDSLLK